MEICTDVKTWLLTTASRLSKAETELASHFQLTLSVCDVPPQCALSLRLF